MTPGMSTPQEVGRERRVQTITHSARSMGQYLLAARGSGKSRMLGRIIAWQDYISGIPQVIFDSIGVTIDNFLDKLVRFLQYVPKRLHRQFWERVIYVPMHEGNVGFPLYYRLGSETLREVSERWLQTLALSEPSLLAAPVHGFAPLHRIGTYTGMVLFALGLQIPRAIDVLRHPKQYLSRFQEAQGRFPEVTEAVSFFTQEYIPMRQHARERLTNSFMDRVFAFTTDPKLHALVGAAKPGIVWSEVERNGQTVLLDYRGVSDRELARFLLLWVFQYLYAWIKKRGRSTQPFGVMIDEFQALGTPGVTGQNPLALLLDEFIQQYMRNHTIWLTVAHQSIKQIRDEGIRQTLLSLGTFLIGRVATMTEARELADLLFRKDPMRIKHVRHSWGRTPYVPGVGGGEPFPLEEVPQYYPLSEQLETAAQKLRNLDRWEFFVRPALSEGRISAEVIPITIAGVDRDKETGEHVFPDQQVLSRVRPLLAQRAGRPILVEQRQGWGQERLIPAPAVPATPLRKKEAIPPPGKPPPPPSASGGQPQLTEEEQTFLIYISEHPDTPVSEVYKQLSLSWYKGNQIRERLTEQGYLAEIETRLGKGGKLTKFFIPTFLACELLGVEPPTGRGGSIHRYIQQLVVQGAEAKGYSATCEYALGNGGIVDVHLENEEGVRVACEIAVVSKVARELAHIQRCLEAKYPSVYTVFVDSYLLARTQEALSSALTEEEAGKVRLVPLNKLAGMV